MTANCILERVAETKSTNDDLLERWRSGQLIDPVARIAHRQTAGKGRAGRAWLSNPDDSICFSVAYPFKRSPAQLAGLSLSVGLAVIEGIAKACNLDKSLILQSGLRLKWPNDLLLNNAKLAGIQHLPVRFVPELSKTRPNGIAVSLELGRRKAPHVLQHDSFWPRLRDQS